MHVRMLVGLFADLKTSCCMRVSDAQSIPPSICWLFDVVVILFWSTVGLQIPHHKTRSTLSGEIALVICYEHAEYPHTPPNREASAFVALAIGRSVT
jgi:hypothetical protein